MDNEATVSDINTDEGLHDKKLRGERAAELLNDPMHKEAQLIIEAALLSSFKDTKLDDDETRREVWRKMNLIGWFDKVLSRAMIDGKVAEKDLLDKKKGVFRRVV